MATATEMVEQAYALIDANDIDGFLELQTPECDWATPTGPLHGHDEVRGFLDGWHEAFPGGVHTLVRTFEVGDTVCVEGVWNGRHTGTLRTPAGDVPPTGRDVHLPFGTFISGDLAGGQARRVAIYFDQLGFMAQLGLLPEPAAA